VVLVLVALALVDAVLSVTVLLVAVLVVLAPPSVLSVSAGLEDCPESQALADTRSSSVAKDFKHESRIFGETSWLVGRH